MEGALLARRLGISESAISRMMTGVHPPSVINVAAVLTACGVARHEWDPILDLCNPQGEAGALRLSDGTQWGACLHHAGEAARLIEYQPVMVPWLAQTEEYAQACWSRTDPPLCEGKLDHDTRWGEWAGAERVELLMHEWALRAPIGTHRAWSAQVYRLLALSKLRNVSVRVVPAYRALRASASSGFTLLEFKRKPSLVYRDEPTSGVFLDSATQVETHLAIVDQLRQLALNVNSSRELLRQIIDEPPLRDLQVDQLPD